MEVSFSFPSLGDGKGKGYDAVHECIPQKLEWLRRTFGTSRISPFGLRGENTAKRFSFSPLLRQIKKKKSNGPYYL